MLSCIIALVAAAALVYKYLTWKYDYWLKRHVPYDPPTLFFGSVKDSILGAIGGAEEIEKIHKRFEGHRYVGYFRFREPALLLRDPELIKQMLVKDFDSFHDNNAWADEKLDPLMAKNPFVLRGNSWKVARSLVTPCFTSGKLRSLVPLMDKVCKRFVKFLEKEAQSSPPDGIDVKELCTKFTTENVASCIFSVEAGSFENPDAELRCLAKTIIEPTFRRRMEFMIIFMLPFLAKFLRLRWIPVEVDRYLRNLCLDIKTHREQTEDVREDFLQVLLNAQKQSPEKYTDEDLIAHCLTFFTDGFETSAIAMSVILYQLGLNPGAQEKLRAEVDRVIEKHGGQITWDAIQDMHYMECVIQESLRMLPPAPFMEKLCTKSYDLETSDGSTYTVEPGTPVVVPIKAVMRDAANFPDPDSFQPERFDGEYNKAAYLAFGTGPRVCLGMRFALLQVKMSIAAVISNFEIRKTSRTLDPFVQDPNALLTSAKGGIWLGFLPRKK